MVHPRVVWSVKRSWSSKSMLRHRLKDRATSCLASFTTVLVSSIARPHMPVHCDGRCNLRSAVVCELIHRKGFGVEDFAVNHPGGSLGEALTKETS